MTKLKKMNQAFKISLTEELAARLKVRANEKAQAFASQSYDDVVKHLKTIVPIEARTYIANQNLKAKPEFLVQLKTDAVI